MELEKGYALIHKDYGGSKTFLRLYYSKDDAEKDRAMITRVPFFTGEVLIEEVEVKMKSVWDSGEEA